MTAVILTWSRVFAKSFSNGEGVAVDFVLPEERSFTGMAKCWGSGGPQGKSMISIVKGKTEIFHTTKCLNLFVPLTTSLPLWVVSGWWDGAENGPFKYMVRGI